MTVSTTNSIVNTQGYIAKHVTHHAIITHYEPTTLTNNVLHINSKKNIHVNEKYLNGYEMNKPTQINQY